MHPEISRLLEQAEQRYLKANELELFQRYVTSLARRLETYEILRDQEESIFQPIADELQAAFGNEPQETVERALKHWLLILRYCASAMLSSDLEFLQLRLNDWVKGLVEASETQKIENKLCELLQSGLKEKLSEKQMALMQPFLAKARQIILVE